LYRHAVCVKKVVIFEWKLMHYKLSLDPLTVPQDRHGGFRLGAVEAVNDDDVLLDRIEAGVFQRDMVSYVYPQSSGARFAKNQKSRSTFGEGPHEFRFAKVC
jgi:hypothetical protein